MGLNGVLSIALGVAFAVHPGAGIHTVLVLLGFYAIVAGAGLIAFAFWIRGIQQDGGPSGSRLAHST